MDSPPIQWATTRDGFAIAYTVTGHGRRDTVFSPNWFSNCELIWEFAPYRRFLERLGSFARLIVLDRRGTGLSDPLGLREVPSLDDRVEDLLTVMSAVGSAQPVLIANGVGAQLATYAVATVPNRFGGLVVLDAGASMRRTPDNPDGLPEEAHERMVAERRSFWGTDDPRHTPGWRTREASAFSARYQRQSTSIGRVEAEMRFNFEVDVRHLLPLVRVPTLVVHHRDNPQLRVGLGRALAESIPGARYIELDGPQFFWGDDPERLADLVEEFVTGAPAAPAVTTQLATVLYTDIVGSTARAAALGDRAWHEALGRHESAVRSALRQFRGEEIKTLGDGFLAVFPSAQNAVRCAAAIVEGVDADGVQVRAGIHSGEIERRSGDIAGIAVAVASRVLGHAGAGEVVVSQTVKDLVLGAALDFQERGERELKGVPGTWRLWVLAG